MGYFIWAGTPTAVELLGTSCNTTALAPIWADEAILISPKSLAPAPIMTPCSMIGAVFGCLFWPNVT